MQNSSWIRWCRAALVVALLASDSVGQQIHRVDDKLLTNAGKNGEEWLTTGRDYSETRYSPLKQIDMESVERLGLAWYFDTGDEAGALEATPIVSNGVLYATATWDVVFALDARTGSLKWRYDPHIGRHNFPPGSRNDPNRVRTGPTILAPVNHGVALYDGKVYVGLLDGRLVALDAETGKVVWEVHTTDPNADYSVTGAPRIVKGMVIIGNAGSEFAVRGYVSAYDAEAGKLIWRFYTIPGDPSKPFENAAMERAANTWKGNVWYKLGGGGTVWDSFAYDPDLDLIYFGTANGGPWDRNWRSPGGGDNLYVSSIIALHAETGEYAWHFQETPGDEWDYDATQNLILADLRVDGVIRKVIMQASKNGFFYVLDRKTGRFLSAATYAYITWATGIDEKTGRPIVAANARYDAKGTVLSPATGGTHNWQVMSFNPNTGLAYFPATDSSFFYAEDTSKFTYHLGQYNRGINATPWGTEQDLDPGAPVPARVVPAMPSNGTQPPPRGSFLVAWDPVAQKERWQVRGMSGGTVTTAGNLVFSSSNDGQLIAFSADKGIKLWEAQLVPGCGSPVTYMVDGTQYVSVLAGRASHGRLYTFALDAKVPFPTTTPVSVVRALGEKTTQDGVYTVDQAERGRTKYLQNCAACHSADLGGVGDAPALAGAPFIQTWNGHSAAELVALVSSTMPKGNPGVLSNEDYADIMAYVFEANNFPAGQREFRNIPSDLENIIISAKKNGQ